MEFTVDTKALKQVAGKLQNTNSNLKSASATVSSVIKSLDTIDEAYAIITKRLRQYNSNLTKVSTKTGRMKSGLTEIAGVYQSTETAISGTKLKSVKVVNAISSPGSAVTGGTKGTVTTGFFNNELNATSKVVIDDDKGDLYYKGEAKVEASVYNVNAKVESQYSETEVNVDVLKAAAAGSVSATLYKNGKLDPSVEAKVKAEAIGIEGKVESRVGTEDNNLHAKAKGALGYASAEAGLKVNKEGAKAEAGAEAYLAKGDLKAGITIMGITLNGAIEGKAGGAGIGASAEASKNKASGYLGAGLALGLGIKLEVDWSGFNWKGKKGTGW